MCPQLTVQMLQLKIPQAKTKTEDPHVLQPRPSKAKINKWFLKRGLGGQGKTSASAASASPAIMSDSDPAWCPSQKHDQQVRACVSSDLPLRSRPGSLCPSSWQACRNQERPSLAKRSLCAHRCVHSDCPSHRRTSCSLVTLLKPRPQLASGSQTCAGRLSLSCLFCGAGATGYFTGSLVLGSTPRQPPVSPTLIQGAHWPVLLSGHLGPRQPPLIL